jgi:hypothetical protein
MDTCSTPNSKIKKAHIRIVVYVLMNSGVCVDAYDVTGQDKNMYHGQIQEI